MSFEILSVVTTITEQRLTNPFVLFDARLVPTPAVQKITRKDLPPFYVSHFHVTYDGSNSNGDTIYNYPSNLLTYFDLPGFEQRIGPLRKI